MGGYLLIFEGIVVVNVRVVVFSSSCRKDSFSRSLESKSNRGVFGF